MTALSKNTPHASRMTAREFETWPDDPSGQLWQLIDGEPVAMAPASQTHGAIQSEIARILGNHLVAHRRACRVVTAGGVQPRVRAQWNVRVPDLVVMCHPDSREHLVAEPVLVVEILSSSNEADSWANVWAYTSIPSIPEIMVVQSLTVGAELLRRTLDGEWPENPDLLTNPITPVAQHSIGATFALADVYRTTGLASPGPPP